jgi:hypothetical protein
VTQYRRSAAGAFLVKLWALMWLPAEFAVELALFVIIPWGAVTALREAIRSRPLTPSPPKSLFLVLGLFGVLFSYILFILTGLWLGALGFLAAYPSLGYIAVNTSMCGLGLFAGLLGRDRFRRGLSVSAVALFTLWLWQMTNLRWRITTWTWG